MQTKNETDNGDKDTFDSILKENNAEIFISNVRMTECPLERGTSYIRSFEETGYSMRTLKDSKLGFASSNIWDKKAIMQTLKRSLDASVHTKEISKSFSFTDSKKTETREKTNDKKISSDPETLASEIKATLEAIAEQNNVLLTTGKLKLIDFEYTIKNSLGIEKTERGTYIEAMLDSKYDTYKPLAEVSSVYSRRMLDRKDLENWFTRRMEITKKCVAPKTMQGGTYDIIASPGVIGPMLIDTIGYWSGGKSRLDKISLFEGKLGKQVAGENFSATDDPTHPDMPSTFGIDMEGAPTARRDIIKDGIFKSHIYDNLYASHLGEKPTSNAKKTTHLGAETIYTAPTFCGLHNLIINNGKETLESMLKDFRGIYIESVGIPSADPETGNFGFELRNAFLVDKNGMTPVRYGIYAGRVQDMIKSIDTLSKDRETVTDPMSPEFNSSCLCPCFLLKNQHISA